MKGDFFSTAIGLIMFVFYSCNTQVDDSQPTVLTVMVRMPELDTLALEILFEIDTITTIKNGEKQGLEIECHHLYSFKKCSVRHRLY